MVVLSFRTIFTRRRLAVSFGDGGHAELTAATRIFGNAAEYIPTGLVGLVFLVKLSGGSTSKNVLMMLLGLALGCVGTDHLFGAGVTTSSSSTQRTAPISTAARGGSVPSSRRNRMSSEVGVFFIQKPASRGPPPSAG